YQGVPEAGYTPIFQKMLDHPQITVRLNTRYQEALPDLDYERLVITGPIDEYFDYSLGALKYRCLRFEFEHLPQESFQNLAVINYPGGEPFTRITEMKKLTFQKHPGTTICREYPSWQGEPSYPVPQKEQKALYRRYEQLAEQEQTKGVFFLGRLGRYKYINMDQAVAEAMELGDYINSKTIE
ncbi:MAG TPA: UDP-galactopyranose mutase, partial [Candidatus Wirthbacteria bacterium]|nr:UDP-galactopyranose mutase [Candidatus Wirthbacteria bacterium]